MRRIALMAAPAVAVLGLGTGPAGAATSDDITVKAAKSQDGPYAKVLHSALAAGAKRTFYVRVKSLGAVEDPVSLLPPAEPTKWTIRVFRGDKEITDDFL